MGQLFSSETKQEFDNVRSIIKIGLDSTTGFLIKNNEIIFPSSENNLNFGIYSKITESEAEQFISYLYDLVHDTEKQSFRYLITGDIGYLINDSDSGLVNLRRHISFENNHLVSVLSRVIESNEKYHNLFWVLNTNYNIENDDEKSYFYGHWLNQLHQIASRRIEYIVYLSGSGSRLYRKSANNEFKQLDYNIISNKYIPDNMVDDMSEFITILNESILKLSQDFTDLDNKNLLIIQTGLMRNKGENSLNGLKLDGFPVSHIYLNHSIESQYDAEDFKEIFLEDTVNNPIGINVIINNDNTFNYNVFNQKMLDDDMEKKSKKQEVVY